MVWAYVANSHLFRSTDHGAVWEERRAPDLINGRIAFINEREGWALSTGSPATGCQGQTFSVLHTADGASTWQSIYQSPIGDGGCKSNIAFVDPLHGYISVSTRDTGSWILRSADGGISWASSTKLPDPPGTTTSDASLSYVNSPGPVADFGDVLFVNGTTSRPTGATIAIFRSTDRGATWSYFGTAPQLGAPEVVFVTRFRWLQILMSNSSRETTDGGLSWHTLATDYGQAAPVAPQFAFGDANIGYATVRGSISRTLDGGLHWTVIGTPGTLSR